MSDNDNDKKELRRALMAVRNHIRRIDRKGTGKYPCTGICVCLSDVPSYDFDGAGHALLRAGFMAWPKFSGNRTFPVPGYPDPEDSYCDGKSKWDVTKPGRKRYTRNRRALLDFLIDWLKVQP